MGDFAVGQPVTRVEDERFLTGRGSFLGDFNLAGQAHMVVLRSPHAHAVIRGVDVATARAAPGVLGVYSATDLDDDLGTTAVTIKRQRADGTPMFWRAHPGLARGRVRHVGDPVAIAIAETAAQARDAAELIEVDYEPLDSVTELRAALEGTGARVWDECPDNLSHVHEMGDRAATDAAFARAAHVVRRSYAVSRVHAQFIETRGALGAYDPLTERFTLYCDTQTPHRAREILAKNVFRIPESRLRVTGFDIGGSFGSKGPQALEHRLVLWAARRLGRPVKWQSDRSEALLADEHGRDNLHEAELALDGEGRFMALRNHWIANVGAYISSDRNFQASFLNTAGITGVYAFASAHVRLSCVMTNSGSLAPYRGAGRPEATYVLERLIDDAARELGIDRVELRRKNLISAAALPLKTPLGFNFDCGDFETCMNKALDLGDWKGFAARREASREKGMLRGIAVVNPIERAGAPSLEFAELRFDPDGAATLFMGTKNHGQGHETAFRQVLASRLGLAPEDVSFVDGDTDRVLHGTGTFGSRSSGLGGSAISLAADKIIVKGKRIAAHLLEAADADLVFEAGRFSVAGTDRAVSLRQVAQAAWKVGKLPKDIEPGLFESATFEAPDSTFPYGTHVCEVEVDPDTGEVRLDRYTVVDDVGNMINPLLVKGQVHGGIGQGAGQALMERIVYDADSGQLLTGSFMDYAMPRAGDLCAFKVDDIVVPTRRNPLGVKGAGEAGAVGALPAVINAVMDALAPLGASKLDMPATAERVWRAINQAGK